MNRDHMLNNILEIERTDAHTAPEHGRATPISLAVIFGLVILTCVFRFKDRLRLGYLWGEDASIFLKGAYERGIRSLFDGYAGYLHFDSRVVTYLVARVSSLQAMPYLLPWTCVLIYGLVSLYLYSVAVKLLGSAWHTTMAAAVIALAPVLMPSSGESYLTITNIQWFLAPAMLACTWELLSYAGSDLRPLQAASRGIFMLTAALTGPMGIIFAAVGGVWFVATVRQPRPAWVRCAIIAFGIGALAQALAMSVVLPKATGLFHDDFSTFPWVSQYFRHFVTEAFYPLGKSEQMAVNFVEMRTYSIAWPVCMFILVAGAACFNRNWRFTSLMLLLVIGLWALGVYRSGRTDVPVSWTMYGERYVFVPHILLLWSMAIAYCSTSRAVVKIIGAASVLLMLAVTARQPRDILWNDQHWSIERTSPMVFEVKVVPVPWGATITDWMHRGQ
jgi:hypothetical protein